MYDLRVFRIRVCKRVRLTRSVHMGRADHTSWPALSGTYTHTNGHRWDEQTDAESLLFVELRSPSAKNLVDEPYRWVDCWHQCPPISGYWLLACRCARVSCFIWPCAFKIPSLHPMAQFAVVVWRQNRSLLSNWLTLNCDLHHDQNDHNTKSMGC